jgi:hypothetical protein
MKRTLLVSLFALCLPSLMMAQTEDDDLYYVPKKKVDNTQVVKRVQPVRTQDVVVVQPTVVVKDTKGNVRDVDEYNRRYTSRENTFSVDNDTLYIEEKPLGEQGEWVNGFEGTQDDYEYAMRIVRFRNPRYAIPVSSPLYWDVVYGAFPSWDWNVYDDGLYAYVFPTYTNRLWWDWRWDSYGLGWGWHSPWYYSSWYGPGYWGGYWGASWAWGGLGWGGSHWGGHWGGAGWGHAWNGSSALNPGIHAGRYMNSRPGAVASRGGVSAGRGTYSSLGRGSMSRGTMGEGRSSSRNYRTGTTSRSTLNGRVVNGRDNGTSVRPSSRTATRSDNSYSRSADGRSTSTYTRPSSTRSSVNSTSREGSAGRGTYREAGSSSSRSNASTRSSSSSNRSSQSSASRSSNSSRNSSSSHSSSSYSSGRSGGSSYSGGGGRSGGGSAGGGGGRSRGR